MDVFQILYTPMYQSSGLMRICSLLMMMTDRDGGERLHFSTHARLSRDKFFEILNFGTTAKKSRRPTL
jgi:hypothetical protein